MKSKDNSGRVVKEISIQSEGIMELGIRVLGGSKEQNILKKTRANVGNVESVERTGLNK